jgi:hypothetical protein
VGTGSFIFCTANWTIRDNVSALSKPTGGYFPREQKPGSAVDDLVYKDLSKITVIIALLQVQGHPH